jgi:hypothetical protein
MAVPSQPAQPTAKVFLQVAEVAFTPPSASPAIIDYRLTATSSSGGATRTVTGALGSPGYIPNLDVGHQYTITVEARNSDGYSTASPASEPVIPARDGLGQTTYFIPRPADATDLATMDDWERIHDESNGNTYHLTYSTTYNGWWLDPGNVVNGVYYRFLRAPYNTVDDYEILTRITRFNPESSTFSYGSALIRYPRTGTGTAQGDGYRIRKVSNVGLDLDRKTNNSTTQIQRVSTSVAMPVWVRIRVSGSNIKVRQWLEGGQEPDTWPIDQTDTNWPNGAPGLNTGQMGVITYWEVRTLTVTHPVQATGTSTTSGSAAATIISGSTTHVATASGSSTTSGSAAVGFPPSAPTSLTATPSSGQASLSWTAPASNGGHALTDYRVQHRSNAAVPTLNIAYVASTATGTNDDVADKEFLANCAFFNATVTGFDDATDPGAGITDYDVIVISASVASADVEARWITSAAVPIVNMEVAAVDDAQFPYNSSQAGSTTTDTVKVVDASAETHPILAALGWRRGVDYTPNSTGTLQRKDPSGAGGQRLLEPSAGGAAFLAVHEAGSAMNGGVAAPARYVWFGSNRGTGASSWTMTADGLHLLAASVLWAAGYNDLSWLTFTDGTSTATTATVTGLSGGPQAFRVQALNSQGYGPYSNYATATIPTVHVGAASGTSTTSGSATISRTSRVTASGSSTTSGSAAAQRTFALTASGTSATSGSAAARQFMQAVASGSSTTSGSAFVTVAPPGAITDLAATSTSTDFNLTWTSPSNVGPPITDYVVQYRVKPS